MQTTPEKEMLRRIERATERIRVLEQQQLAAAMSALRVLVGVDTPQANKVGIDNKFREDCEVILEKLSTGWINF